MQTQFSTNNVHPRDRFDFWHEVACRKITPHQSWPRNRMAFHAHIETGQLVDATIIQFDNAPMTVEHGPRDAARAPDDDLFIHRQLSGGFLLDREGRAVEIREGDIALIDPSLPCRGHFQTGSSSLTLKVPRRKIRARVGGTSDKTLFCLDRGLDETRLLTTFIAELPALTDRLQPTTREMVQEQILDLFAVSLMKSLCKDRPRLSSAASVVLLKVRTAIEARLSDPELDAEKVAAAAGVSIRYANAVLARDNTSIRRLMQARRLERCRRALADPLQSHRTLLDIAYGWGFSDMTHFTRRFKRAYGILPSEYRKLSMDRRS